MTSSAAVRLVLIADTHLPKRARDLPAQLWTAIADADVVLHAGQQAARPPTPYQRWAAWAAVRWPSLPSLPSWDGLENWGARPPSPA